jgi:hypothetical protein
MNWEAIIGVAEIVSAIVVVASLGYVALQIRQNTQATRYQTTHNLITANSDANFLAATNSDMAAIMHKGAYDFDSLTGEEQMRYSMFYFAYYNHLDFAYHQYKNGQIDEAMWQKMAYEMPLYTKNLPGNREWWSRDKARLSKEFVAYLEERMANMEPSSSVPSISRPKDNSAT